MKKILKSIYILLIIVSTSCSKDEAPQNNDCSNFSIAVKTFTSNYSAWVEPTGGTQPISYQWSNGATTVSIGDNEAPLAVGSYTVTVTDGKGCVKTGSIIISHQAAVVTNTIDCVGSNKAIIEVKVTDDGDSTISEKGVCYSLTPNPTVSNTKAVFSSVYDWSIEILPLSLGTTYYARGYAINSAGVSYAPQLSFTTNSTSSPLSIGQTYQGGIIAWLTCDGLHGYVVRSTEMPDTASWDIANENSQNLVHNGYSDWYLPNITQVKQIRENLHSQGIGNFNTGNTIFDNYWSSPRFFESLPSSYTAFYWDYDANTGAELSTSYHLHYRPVRDF